MMKRLLLVLTLAMAGCSTLAQPSVDACMEGIDTAIALTIEKTLEACNVELESVYDILNASTENTNQLVLIADFYLARTKYLEVLLDFTEAERQYLGCMGTWSGDEEPLCKSPEYPADELEFLREEMIAAGDAFVQYTEEIE